MLEMARQIQRALILKTYLISATALATPLDIPDFDWLYQPDKVDYIEQIVNYSAFHDANTPLELYPVVYQVDDTEKALALLAQLGQEGFSKLAKALQAINWQSNHPLISLIELIQENDLFAAFLEESTAISNILTAYNARIKIKTDNDNVEFILWIQRLFAHYGEMIENGTIEESTLKFIYQRQHLQDELFSLATQAPQCLSTVCNNHHLYEAAQLLPSMQLPGISTLAQAVTHTGNLPCALQLSNAAQVILATAGSVYESEASVVQIPSGYDNLYAALLNYLYNNQSELIQYAMGIATYIIHHSVNGIGSPPSIAEGCDEPLVQFLNVHWQNMNALNAMPTEMIVMAIYDPQSIAIGNESTLPESDSPPQTEEPPLSFPAQETHGSSPD